MSELKNNVTKICKKAFTLLNEDEILNINVNGEQTKFIRLNNAKIRQTTDVEQFQFYFALIKDNRKMEFECMIETWNLDEMTKIIESQLNKARTLITQVPEDPYIVVVENQTSDVDVKQVEIDVEKVLADILTKAKGHDFCGLFTAGHVYRGFFNNRGCQHWFANSLNVIDYSIYAAKQRAVKGIYANKTWDQNAFEKEFDQSVRNLELMEKPWHQLEKGKYRCYLAPEAVAELVGMFSWCGVSYKDYKLGSSAFKKLHEGKHWSKKFNLTENLGLGAVQIFNGVGEIASERLEIVKQGKLENFLVSSRSAKEFGVDSNFCSTHEYLSCPTIEAGDLTEDEILRELGTGLYFSNLHYLNWSDLNNGRVTGMTRFACFWVEDGKIVAPIKEMRFDDELYHIFGDGLIELTEFTKDIPSTDTYFQRNMGLYRVPGALINDFTLTL